MCSQIKNSSFYNVDLLISSYRSLITGATLINGATILAIFTDAMSTDNTVFSMIIAVSGLFGLGLLLYGVMKWILSIPITLFRVLRYQEYEEVTEPPELTDAAKKTRFLELEKEWIALQAKRAGELER